MLVRSVKFVPRAGNQPAGALAPDHRRVEMQTKTTRSPAPGVITKHARACASRTGKRCSCEPGHQAWAYDRRSGKKVYKTFPTLAQAKRWRSHSQLAVANGSKRARQ